MPEPPAAAPVLIVGGGFSGAAVAWHLARLRPGLGPIRIVEPRGALGRGLAYSTADPSHRINVPAARMSLDPDQPAHFNDWLLASGHLRSDPAARLPDGRNFPARSVFGEYVGAELARLGDRIQHITASVASLETADGGYRANLSNGETLGASIVVLAVCHAPPAAPERLSRALAGHPRYSPDPWTPAALAAVRPDDRVLIVGAGLTMADLVAGLDRRGHRGRIVAVSRRGQRSRGHPDEAAEPFGDFGSDPAVTARELLVRIRAAVAELAQAGKSWHAALDQARLQGTTIWRALPQTEQRRLLRHLRPFWDAHRFRIAPQIEHLLDERKRQRAFELRAASIKAVERAGDEIRIDLRDRRSGRVETIRVDAVLVATGPAHGAVFSSVPFLAALNAAGLARPDPNGLGIDIDLHGRAIGADGRARADLFVAGPLARNAFGELMGLPEVTQHAVRVANGVAMALDSAGAGAHWLARASRAKMG